MANKSSYTGKTAKEYDKNRFLSKQGSTISKMEIDTYNSLFSLITPIDSALEVGCGTGRFTEITSVKVNNLIATDVSDDMLEIAKNKLSSLQNITFVNEEFINIHKYLNNIDLVYAIRVLNQLENINYFYDGFDRIVGSMKKGSHFILEFVNDNRPFKLNRPNSVRLSLKKINSHLENISLNESIDYKSIKGVFFSV
jgi:ubiquinone/menaquinone biosynthesis C-methylase UbiE